MSNLKNRLMRLSSRTTKINNLILKQLENELNSLSEYLDTDIGDSYIVAFNGIVIIKCNEQIGSFNLNLNFDGDKVTITNENSDNIETMKNIF